MERVGKKVLRVFLSVLLLLLPQVGGSAILFEGYSKVLLGGVHVGYYVARYEFNEKKHQFVAAYLFKTNEFGGNITESLKATSDEKLGPVDYQYTTITKKGVKAIDATFSGGRMRASVTEGGKITKIDNAVPQGTFLGIMLYYVMLKSKTGLSSNTKYEYSAIAEEDGKITKGIAVVDKKETLKGLAVYKVLNEFNGGKFVSYLSEQGELIVSKSPAQAVTTELVKDPLSATEGFPVSHGNLKLLFGEVPEGKINSLTKALSK